MAVDRIDQLSLLADSLKEMADFRVALFLVISALYIMAEWITIKTTMMKVFGLKYISLLFLVRSIIPMPIFGRDVNMDKWAYIMQEG